MSDRPRLYHEADQFEVILHHSLETRYAEETHETVQICIPFEGARYEVTRSSETGALCTSLLGAGDILVVPDQQPHAIYWQRPADILSLQLSISFLEQVLGRPRPQLRDTLVLRDQFLSDAAIELRRVALDGDAQAPLVGAFAAMIAYKIGRNSEDQYARPNGPIRPLSTAERGRVVDFISANLERQIRIAELAHLVGISQWHFLRRFTASEGMSPNSFITKQRIEKAAALLAGSATRVTDIAFDVGMSPSHLSRTFLQRMGVSPKAFRQQHGL